MQIRYTWHWRWGDKSTVVYDLSNPGSRSDLARVISEIKTGQACKDIVHHQFEEVKLISVEAIITHLENAK